MDSHYYELELNIKGHKILKECLDEFFEVMPTLYILFGVHTSFRRSYSVSFVMSSSCSVFHG